MTDDAPRVALASTWVRVHESATPVSPTAGHHVIVAPHPDDEVLTVGGLIQRVEASDGWTQVLAVTDGGSAYPNEYDHDALAALRRREQVAALTHVGVDVDRIVSMHVRDGQVAAHHDDLVARICSMCTPDTTIVAPWVHDVHSDHEAVGRAAVEAADLVGCSLWFSLFWAWHHRQPTDFEGAQLLRVDLDESMRAKKRGAVECHVTQLAPSSAEPVLHADNLGPAEWPAEFFILARDRASRP